MSHIVTIQTRLTDPAAIVAACRRLRLAAPGDRQEHTLFARQKVTGRAVKLPDWQYPVVIDDDGRAQYDNFNGNWGEQKHLDAFVQAYAVEKAKLEARKAGHTCTEQTQADGSIRLTIETGA